MGHLKYREGHLLPVWTTMAMQGDSAALPATSMHE
jgi:hypothetical protein